MDRSPTKVAIVGAGKGGIALLELLHQIPDVDIVGITDKDPAAPGLQRARDLSIHVTEQVPDLVGNHGVNLILDVTGDPGMQETILSHKDPAAEVLHGPTAKLLWNLIQHESKLETELFHAEKLAGLGSFARVRPPLAQGSPPLPCRASAVRDVQCTRHCFGGCDR